MEKDYVDYILNGDPGIPDEELTVLDGITNDAPVSAKGKKPDKWDIARELYNQGWTDGKIAKEIGMSSNSVWNWRKKEGLPPNARPAGEKAINKDVKVIQNPIVAEQDKRPAITEIEEQESLPPPMTALAVMSLRILYDIWQILGKEEIA